jgi:eukaryotic-like serine/threonine-protein kinase
MASVWVARQSGKHGFEKLVAIKTILPKFATDVRFQEMFLDEARIASRIEHVNVAQIFDLGEEHDILYLAMEYVDGDSLSKLNRACLRQGIKIPTGVILRVLADTCAGLHEAHELKDGVGRPLEIVHRDVSPHNILVSSRGVAKLVDFGIAKARSRMGSDTNSGVLKGKIAYMAPEQALGHAMDRRADIWAVGAILYHLLAGRPPYEADNQLATLHLLGSGRPPPPLPSSVHPVIGAIVRRALTYAPDARCSTAAEMRDSIEQGMVTARLTTTSGDVAAFAALHLCDRAEKRRSAIDDALAIAAERMRVEQRLEARGRATLALAPDSNTSLPPSSVPSLGQPRDSMTLADTPEALIPPIELIAKLTPRLSDAPQPSSYATLGLAAVDASVPLPPSPRSRKGPLAIVGLLLIAVAVAAAARLDVLRPDAAPSHASTPSPVMATRPPPVVVPSATPTVTVAPTSTGTSWSLLPTVNASALPKATGTATTPLAPEPVVRPRPQRWVAPRKTPTSQESEPEPTPEPAAPAPEPPPPPTPAPSPGPAPRPSKNGPVDDGF